MANYFLDDIASKTVFGILPALTYEPADANTGSPAIYKGGQYPTSMTVSRVNMATGYGLVKAQGIENFDGSNDNISLGTDIGNLSGNKFSIAMWASFPSTTIGGSFKYPFYKQVDSSKRISWIFNGNTFYLYVVNGTASYGYVATSDNFTADTLTLINVVFDGSGATNADKLKLYINNVQKTLTFSGTMPSTLPDLSTATASLSLATGAIGGYIKGFIFCNNTLSATDVSQLYTLGPTLGGLKGVANGDGTMELSLPSSSSEMYSNLPSISKMFKYLRRIDIQ